MNESQSQMTTDAIETSNYKKITRFLNGTAKRAQFSYLFGPTGYGKTFAVRDWIRRNGNAAYVRARTGSTQSRLRRQISEAVFGSDDYRERDILKFFQQHPGFVLVIDECNHLIADANLSSAKCLDSVRDYYDEVNDAGGKFGLCFIFTEYSLERLSKCRISAFLQQFINRADNHLCLTPRNFKKGEIDPTVRAYFPDAPQELFDFAYKFSDVRSLHKRFSAAKAIWQGRIITRAMLEELQFQFETGEREDK